MSENLSATDQKMLEVLRAGREAVEAQMVDEAKAMRAEAQFEAEATTIEAQIVDDAYELKKLMLGSGVKTKRISHFRAKELHRDADKLVSQNPSLSRHHARQLVKLKQQRQDSKLPSATTTGHKPRTFRTRPFLLTEAEPTPNTGDDTFAPDAITQSWFVELDNGLMPAENGLIGRAMLTIYVRGQSKQSPEPFEQPVYEVTAYKYQKRHVLSVQHEDQPAEGSDLYAVLGFIAAAQAEYRA